MTEYKTVASNARVDRHYVSRILSLYYVWSSFEYLMDGSAPTRRIASFDALEFDTLITWGSE